MLATIFSAFNDKQVRFFKVTAEIIPAEKSEEMTKCNVESSPVQKPRVKYRISALPPHIARHTRERIGIPMSDFAEAVNYSIQAIHQMFIRNPESFEGYWTTLPIPDALGRMQQTIILFEEAIVGLTMKLQETRLKDPAVKEAVIKFKRWVMEIIPAIRRGEIRPVRVLNKIEGFLPEYCEAIQSVGYDRSDKVADIAEKDEVTCATIYSRLKLINGGQNLPTKKGVSKKSPSFKGISKMPLEYQKIIDTYLADPCLPNKDIWQRSGTKYSYGHTNLILRGFKKQAIAA